MRRFLPLISSLLLVLVLWTGTASHAAEVVDCGEVASSNVGHFEGDRDEVPSDSDKATPHHHNACHGHCMATPSGDEAVSFLHAVPSAPAEAALDFHSGGSPGAALRPPIA